MASRKETPDVLGELLGAGMSAPGPAEAAEPESPPPGPPESASTPPASEKAPAAEKKPAGEEEAPAQRRVESRPAPRRRAPGRQRRTGRVRWEYVEIVFCDHGGYRPRSINGREAQHWKKAPLMRDYLNHLGEQGWELAGAGCMGRKRMLAYLKRRKAS